MTCLGFNSSGCRLSAASGLVKLPSVIQLTGLFNHETLAAGEVIWIEFGVARNRDATLDNYSRTEKVFCRSNTFPLVEFIEKKCMHDCRWIQKMARNKIRNREIIDLWETIFSWLVQLTTLGEQINKEFLEPGLSAAARVYTNFIVLPNSLSCLHQAM